MDHLQTSERRPLKNLKFKLLLPMQLSLCAACFLSLPLAAESERYQLLKQRVFAEAYAELPRYEVTRRSFEGSSGGGTAGLAEDAKRTLSSHDDLLGPERGPKLLQANGICFAGYWEISEQSGYTGVFELGRRVPVIARASTIFSGTRQSERRSFGMAVKLLPDDLGDAPSLSVFSSHSAGGVTQPYMLDLSMDNEPPLGRIPSWRDIRTALKLKSILLKADGQAGSDKPSITYRGVAALGQYNVQGSGRSPHWIRFSPGTQERIDREDFRDELRVENYRGNQLVYNIDVGDQADVLDKAKKKKSSALWQTIGKLVFTESITSRVCDTQLHFPHPKN